MIQRTMVEQPPVPPGAEALPAWLEEAEAESGDLGDLAGELPLLVLFLLTVSLFFAVVIAVVLTLVQVAKFPWLVG